MQRRLLKKVQKRHFRALLRLYLQKLDLAFAQQLATFQRLGIKILMSLFRLQKVAQFRKDEHASTLIVQQVALYLLVEKEIAEPDIAASTQLYVVKR